MNAKFEKWYIDLLRNPLARAYNNPLNMPTDGDMHRAMEMGWQAALQSLEVPPELEDMLRDILEVRGVRMSADDAHEALTAVFDAIKEQAK